MPISIVSVSIVSLSFKLWGGSHTAMPFTLNMIFLLCKDCIFIYTLRASAEPALPYDDLAPMIRGDSDDLPQLATSELMPLLPIQWTMCYCQENGSVPPGCKIFFSSQRMQFLENASIVNVTVWVFVLI